MKANCLHNTTILQQGMTVKDREFRRPENTRFSVPQNIQCIHKPGLTAWPLHAVLPAAFIKNFHSIENMNHVNHWLPTVKRCFINTFDLRLK